jgi:hypothetical protein
MEAKDIKQEQLDAYLEATWNKGEYKEECPCCGHSMTTVEKFTDCSHYHDLTCTRCKVDITHMFRFSHASGRVADENGERPEDNKCCGDAEDNSLWYQPLQRLRFTAKAFMMLDESLYHHVLKGKGDWISEVLRGLAAKVPKEDWPMVLIQGEKENPQVLALAKEALGHSEITNSEGATQ